MNAEFTGKPMAEKIRLCILEYSAEPSIYELEIYGTLHAEDISTGKAATANNVYSDTYSPDKALDGDLGTRWATQNEIAGSAIFEIDLTGKYSLDSFYIIECSERINGYVWERYWGGEWTVCHEVLDGAMLGQFAGIPAAEKLRLRIFDYSDAPTIYEIKVYGRAVPEGEENSAADEESGATDAENSTVNNGGDDSVTNTDKKLPRFNGVEIPRDILILGVAVAAAAVVLIGIIAVSCIAISKRR